MTKNKARSNAAPGPGKKLRPEESKKFDEDDVDDDDDDDDDVDDNDDDNDDNDDDEEEGSITVALVDYAHTLLNAPATVTSPELQAKAEKALTQAMVLAMAEDEGGGLRKMLDKGRGRDLTDGKVPPGSAAVRRTLLDARFLLCAACVALAKVRDLRGDEDGAIRHLRDALIFFPRSAEANEFLGRLLKTQADSADKLGKVEFFFRRSASAAEDIAATIAALRPFAPAIESSSSSGGAVSADSLSYAEFSSAPDLGRDLRLLEKEQAASGQALQALALLLCQAGRVDEATPLLTGQGFRWRLARDVLCYGDETEGDSVPMTSLTALPVRVVDGALPPPMLQHLQQVFRAASPFWAEHYYDAVSNASRAVGYFSYLFPLTTPPPLPPPQARCSVEQVILYLFHTYVTRMFPAAADATVAEWWVHSRPHSSGHQLHFDSDETGLEGGGRAEHPICSLVVYLGDDREHAAVGGPTLVTDQTLGGPLATRGWLCHPRCNRLAAFDAQYLHGVVPGRGPNPRVGARRLTFMVGFWRAIKARPRGLDQAGPGQPFPTGAETKYTWQREMALRPDFPTAVEQGDPMTLVPPQPFAVVWEPVEAASTSASAGKKAAVAGVDYDTCFQGF